MTRLEDLRRLRARVLDGAPVAEAAPGALRLASCRAAPAAYRQDDAAIDARIAAWVELQVAFRARRERHDAPPAAHGSGAA